MDIKIISSSIREGRNSHNVALFIEKWIKENTNHTVSVLDLKALDFPLFKERLKFMNHADDKVVQFGKDIDNADAVFIVSPEYNGSFPASLKNVVDLLFEEWQQKPICLSLVSRGIFAGTQVTKDLAFLMYRIGALVAKSRVHVGQVVETFNEKGEILDKEEFYNKVMNNSIKELESLASINQK